MARLLPSFVIVICCLGTTACGGADSTAEVAVSARPSPPHGASTASGGLLVDVGGRVRRPGVYRLATGARVHDAIEAAGGILPGADLADINRAAPIVDGQQLRVAERGVQAEDTARGGAVSVNAAGEAALDALPGIGPVTAERIVAERESGGPFATIDDLDRVSGIGPATIEALREVATT